MEFLKWLQELRTPFLDGVFGTITHLGEETFFIVLGILFFWCISKREGYLLGLMVAFEVESRYIRFETKAVWWVQILKAVLGLRR